MKIQSLVLVTAMSLLISGVNHAEPGKHTGKRQNFTRDMTHTTGSGKTLSRHTEQVVSENGFTRTSTTAAPNGNTASRTVTGERDPENNTYTRTVEGTRMNGEAYSRESVINRNLNADSAE